MNSLNTQSSLSQSLFTQNNTTMSQSNQESNVNSNNGINSKTTAPTFSKVVNNSLFPKKTQAIVIDAIEGIQLKEYHNAIAT